MLAFVLGLAPAHADPIAGEHDGGAKAARTPAIGVGKASTLGGSDIRSLDLDLDWSREAGHPGLSDRWPGRPSMKQLTADDPAASVSVEVEEDGIGTDDWTQTVTHTITTATEISSVTKSYSYAGDEDGDSAVATAFAEATAPTRIRELRTDPGTVFAETSVEVVGNAAATADAGGSIEQTSSGVKVSTWGETSATVY